MKQSSLLRQYLNASYVLGLVSGSSMIAGLFLIGIVATTDGPHWVAPVFFLCAVILGMISIWCGKKYEKLANKIDDIFSHLQPPADTTKYTFWNQSS